MILTNNPSTAKQRQEHRLLVDIHFAALLHNLRAPNTEPMASKRVQQRLHDLEHHLHYNHPSQVFYLQFCEKTGQLGSNYSFHFNPHTGQAVIHNNTLATVHSLALVCA